MGIMEEKLRELIVKSYGSIPKFAAVANISPQTIYSLLKSDLRRSKMDTVMPVAATLRLDPFQLMQNKIVKLPKGEKGYVDVPLYGSIAAGDAQQPIIAEQTFPIPAKLIEEYPNAFLLKISGESMNRMLPDGSYALIQPCETVESGQPYAVCVGTAAATVKRVRVLENGIALEPNSTDPTFKPRIFDFDDASEEEVRIIGRVVWFCPPLSWQTDD